MFNNEIQVDSHLSKAMNRMTWISIGYCVLLWCEQTEKWFTQIFFEIGLLVSPFCHRLVIKIYRSECFRTGHVTRSQTRLMLLFPILKIATIYVAILGQFQQTLLLCFGNILNVLIFTISVLFQGRSTFKMVAWIDFLTVLILIQQTQVLWAEILGGVPMGGGVWQWLYQILVSPTPPGWAAILLLPRKLTHIVLSCSLPLCL